MSDINATRLPLILLAALGIPSDDADSTLTRGER
uniref:MSDIN-like toxin proprotein 6 n=1 Tax=Amanita phalloides TaxID=67723 RepID=MSD6_AMAPH|nr:RecName: Full=MSDIN-like toxin proprotein 6; Contains: RecName: Full=Toxin MSD6; Flags: Precursor [Amanita phalloides]AHB18712.1 MSDIN-like protein [Amanita phalloides]